MLNAVTEYVDHNRTTRITEARKMYTPWQARVESAVFGSGATLKTNALDLILKETERCKVREPKIYSGSILDSVINATV